MIPVWLPVTDEETVSVAVIDWLPAVLSVALKEAGAPGERAIAGSVAASSVLVKWTVPAYAVSVLLNAIVRGDGHAVRVAGRRRIANPVTLRWVAAAGVTVIPVWVPVIETVPMSVAVIDWLPAVLSVTLNTWTPLSPPVNAWSPAAPRRRRCW